MQLYIHPASPNARRARIAARLCNVEVDETVVDLAKGETRTPEYLALNPMGKVPTLVKDDGGALLESHAIAHYLASGTRALPQGQLDQVLRWQFFDAAHLAPPLGTLTFQHLFRETPDAEAVESALADYRRYAAVVEAALQQTRFC